MRHIFKTYGCVALLLVGLMSCGKKGETNTTSNPKDSTNQVDNQPTPEQKIDLGDRFYCIFDGQINNKLDIEMTLNVLESTVKGSYFYKSQKKSIYLSGKKEGNKINLEENVNGTVTGKFSGTLENGVYAGEWTGNGKTMPFSVKFALTDDVTLFAPYTGGKEQKLKEVEGSAQAKIQQDYLHPIKGTEAMQKAFIKFFFGDKVSGTDPQAIVDKVVDDFIKGYLADGAEYSDDDAKDFSLNYEISDNMGILYNKNEIVSAYQSSYQYMGGAHGMGAVSNFIYDVKRERVLEVGDILDTSQKDKINKLLVKAAFDTYGEGQEDAKSLRDLGFFDDKIEMNKNVFISSTGVGFDYAPYEVGPYAMGPVTLEFSYDELKKEGLLKKDFAERIGK